MSEIDALKEVVSPAILKRAAAVSERLRELEIPHALVGGLAVGIHGHPRATRDVDVMVGEEAFASLAPVLVYREELVDLARTGSTDIMCIPESYPGLADELRLGDDIPVISLRGLILLKLDAFRARDREDVRALLGRAPDRVLGVRDYLQAHAPELVHRLSEVLANSF
ncbi:MAG: hypothetical protein JXR96_09820 [Deltaproteobacteria bacterium]|nr:hypothetical protein [Deltaproteobacteria bacterium]